MTENISLELAASVYIPIDRRHAMARGQTLPEQAQGATLFADISGFTRLTEALTQALGPWRGTEELPRHLNLVYDALIAQVHAYHGSVIGFSGDAITCWFEEPSPVEQVNPSEPIAPRRAVSCALALQQAMTQFAALEIPGQAAVQLEIKVVVASGRARRFLVGDPDVQYIDALAGQTLTRMANAESLAGKGQVVIDTPTLASLGQAHAHVRELGEGERFFVLDSLEGGAPPSPWPALPAGALSLDDLKPWILPTVYERLHEGLGDFLTELRPTVALFLRFSGIDYDQDVAAGDKLDAYIRWVQAVVTRYEGTLIQLTIGEKGSYLYAAFGAPIAHEDDPQRAVDAAMVLRAPPPELDFIRQAQIGISRGVMRTGAYGGTTRRTYGALGDEVNLAARLMQRAVPGEVLVSRRIQKATALAFAWDTLEPVQMKGKLEPVPVARLLGKRQTQLSMVSYTTPLVGRQNELANLLRFFQPILSGQTQASGFARLAYIYGEAGMGKTRLVHELRQRVQQITLHDQNVSFDLDHKLHTAWVVCPGDAISRQSFYPFRHFLYRYFRQEPDGSEEENKARFNQVLDALISDMNALSAPGAQHRPEALSVTELVSDLGRARSVLGAMVDLYWAGSLYEQLEPKLRFENTLAAFRTLITIESLRQPLVVYVEDAHWLDADSFEMIAALLHSPGVFPFVVLLCGRYRDDGSRFGVKLEKTTPKPESGAPATNEPETGASELVIDLGRLPPADAAALAGQTLSQLVASPGGAVARALQTLNWPGASPGGAISDELSMLLAEKTDGNPLFVEQLILHLHERGAIKLDGLQWRLAHEELADLPESVNAVLVARLDRLAAHLRAVVQTAAVVGREFQIQVLSHMLRGDGALPLKVRQAEAEMIWAAVSEARYMFRHALLRDAAYDMQISARLRDLHALVGAAMEQLYAADLGPYYADLAYHYGKAEDTARELRYTRLAGERAAAQFAGAQAVAYFSRALSLVADTDAETRYALLLARENVYDLQGARQAQAQDLEELEKLARWLDETGDRPAGHKRAAVMLRRANYAEVTHDYPAASQAAQAAIALAESAQDSDIQAKGYRRWGIVLWRQGDHAAAQQRLEQALALAREIGATDVEADSLRELGTVSRRRGDYQQARAHFEQALRLYRELGNQQGEAIIFNNLANVLIGQTDYAGAREYYEQCYTIMHMIGDRRREGIVLINLGVVAEKQGDYGGARDYYVHAVHIARDVNDQGMEATALLNLGNTVCKQGDYEAARAYSQHAVLLARALGARSIEGYALTYLGWALTGLGQWAEADAVYRQAIQLRRELDEVNLAMESLAGLANAEMAQGRLPQAQEHVAEILAYLETGGNLAEEPFQVYLVCYQVLRAAGDERAVALLTTAHDLLQTQAARTPDEQARHSLLQNVAAHREIMREYARLTG